MNTNMTGSRWFLKIFAFLLFGKNVTLALEGLNYAYPIIEGNCPSSLVSGTVVIMGQAGSVVSAEEIPLSPVKQINIDQTTIP